MRLSDKLSEMVNLYYSERKSLNEVGRMIGCSGKSVEYHLKKNGYRLRTISESLKGREVSEHARETARRLGKQRIGKKNPVWKGKVRRGNGYIAVRKTDHPHATKCGYVMEHRLIMEKHIGRYLTKDEDVHHINGDKKDNRIENLKLMSKSEHSMHHGNERVENGTHNNFIYLTDEDIMQAIEKGGTVKQIAKRLNIDKTTFYKKLKRHNLEEWYKEWRGKQ